MIAELLAAMKKQKAVPAPMQYNPGAMRQFTPSPAPDMPFMPAPQVGPQQIHTGFPGAPQGGPNIGPGMPAQGGLAGFGGQPNIGPGLPPAPQMPTGPDIAGMISGKSDGTPHPGLGGAINKLGGRQLNPQMAQYAMQLLQRARSQPIQMQPMQAFRGGR